MNRRKEIPRADEMNRTVARAGASLLAINQAILGCWALLTPRSFYADFPDGTGWVAALPPYNEHLVRDVGGLSVAFAVLFGAVVCRPTALLVRASMCAWLAAAVPHLIFHLEHLGPFGLAAAIEQTAGLSLVTVVPIVLLIATRTRRTGAA